MTAWILPALAVALCSSGCGGSSGPGGLVHDAHASRATTVPVAQKTVHLLPDGILYISVLKGPGTPGPGGPDANADGLLWVAPAATSGQAGEWYFISARPASQRTAPVPYPGAREVYATADLPLLPRVDQHETVLRVDLQANGRSQAHRSGGVEVIVVLEGNVEVHSGTFSPRRLTVGQGAFVLENTPLQAWSLGGLPASYLDFYLLPSGKLLAQDDQFSP